MNKKNEGRDYTGWLVVIIGLFVIASLFVSAQITLNDEYFNGCWGSNLCGDDYTCGYYDQVCVNDFFTPSLADNCNIFYVDEGYSKCIDPDCGPDTCFYGTVQDQNFNSIPNAIVRYEQEVWNGTNVVILQSEATTNAWGTYNLSAWPGNDILLEAEKRRLTRCA